LQRAKQEAARDNSAKSLFDFINVRLGGAKKGSWRDATSSAPPPPGPSRDLWTPGSKNQHQTSKNKRTPLTKETNERLKIESFKMDEKLRGLERDIARLRDSWHRHRYT
jgi:hypothetical protein